MNPFKWTEKGLQEAIRHNIVGRGHSCVAPNIFLPEFTNESDLVSVTNNLYLWEYEIKLTKQDFLCGSEKVQAQELPKPKLPKSQKRKSVLVRHAGNKKRWED